jgi:3-methyladenine DNA glycosylase AlkD
MGRTRKSRIITAEDRPLTEAEAELAAEARAYAESDAEYEQYHEPEAEEDLGPPPSVADAIAALECCGDADKAAGAAAYHKLPRRYLGVPVPLIEDMARLWRAQSTLDERLALAAGLWDSDIHEARVAATKLLAQARIRPDQAVWDLICTWVPDFDGWALADHACKAAEKRLQADPARIETVAGWVQSDHLWTRRAALVITLPWTKQNHPSEADRAIRARVLGWCAELAQSPEWFLQKAVAWWLRDLSKHDPQAVRDWLAAHGDSLKPFARKEASRYL